MATETYEKVTHITDKHGVTKQVHDPEAARAEDVYTKEEVDVLMYSRQVSQTETSVTIRPNELNVWGRVAALEIAFSDGTAGSVMEYMLQFKVGSDNFTLTLPDGVKWVNDPDFTNGNTYQVSIVNNLAVYAEWEA